MPGSEAQGFPPVHALVAWVSVSLAQATAESGSDVNVDVNGGECGQQTKRFAFAGTASAGFIAPLRRSNNIIPWKPEAINRFRSFFLLPPIEAVFPV